MAIKTPLNRLLVAGFDVIISSLAWFVRKHTAQMSADKSSR
jgi:hypothetical protein